MHFLHRFLKLTVNRFIETCKSKFCSFTSSLIRSDISSKAEIPNVVWHVSPFFEKFKTLFAAQKMWITPQVLWRLFIYFLDSFMIFFNHKMKLVWCFRAISLSKSWSYLDIVISEYSRNTMYNVKWHLWVASWHLRMYN